MRLGFTERKGADRLVGTCVRWRSWSDADGRGDRANGDDEPSGGQMTERKKGGGGGDKTETRATVTTRTDVQTHTHTHRRGGRDDGVYKYDSRDNQTQVRHAIIS